MMSKFKPRLRASASAFRRLHEAETDQYA
jgi:hypothetical protein